jgi:hypothetical protein
VATAPTLTNNPNDESQQPLAVAHDATKQESPSPELGPNNEKLEELRPELVSQLRKLVFSYRQEGIFGRRLEIRRIRQARLFWQELQYGWFDPFSMNWRMPAGNMGLAADQGDSQQDWGKFMFVTNFYQAFGLSFISLISQDVPSVVFYPEDVDKGEDISAAKAAQTAVELIEFNNQVSEMLTMVGYFLWTDGKIGSYTRYVADGENFGYKEVPDLAPDVQPFGEDEYDCLECGAATPASQMQMGMMCPQCGRPLDDSNLRPATPVTVPGVTATRKMPNGREIISIIGGLELNTPIWATDQNEFPYLQWQREVHRAKLKAIYPHVAKKIGQMSGVEGPDDTYARVSRLGVAQGMPTLHPGDSLSSLVTFMQTWIEPWAFSVIEEDEIRQQLTQLFPDGAYVAFAGDTYCESRNERLRDHWRVMHALPGDGQSRPSVGNSMIQVQERYNSLDNITMEHYEFGIPPIYVDPQTLDFDALTQQVAEPGAHYPARAKPGMPLNASFYQPSPPIITKDMIQYQQELVGPVAQMLTGLFPAVYGGSMDDIKTASAYAQARDQALGRLGMVWRRLKQFYSDTMQIAVQCFRDNRTEDAQIPFKNNGGEFEAKRISLADLQGSTNARPEADETYPRLKSQQKAVLQQLMSVDDPMVQKFFSEPKNLELLINIMGLNDFTIPEADSRIKQLKEIDQLLQGQPIDIRPLDNHLAEFMECQRWLSSDKGLEAKLANPVGFALVEQHGIQHGMLAGVPGLAPAPAPSAESAGGGGGGPQPTGEPTPPMPAAPEPAV